MASNANRWTEYDDAVLAELYKNHRSIYTIARTLDRTYAATNQRRVALGIPARAAYRPVAQAEINKAKRLRRSGKTYDQIAESLGRSRGTTWYLLTKAGF